MFARLPAAQLQGLPHLEPAIVEALFWAATPTLNTVHPLEEQVGPGRTPNSHMVTSSTHIVNQSAHYVS